MLHITEDDKIVDFKYVFQTRLTKSTLDRKIRGPEDLFNVNETFIDNDGQLVVDKLSEYYK